MTQKTVETGNWNFAQWMKQDYVWVQFRYPDGFVTKPTRYYPKREAGVPYRVVRWDGGLYLLIHEARFGFQRGKESFLFVAGIPTPVRVVEAPGTDLGGDLVKFAEGEPRRARVVPVAVSAHELASWIDAKVVQDALVGMNLSKVIRNTFTVSLILLGLVGMNLLLEYSNHSG